MGLCGCMYRTLSHAVLCPECVWSVVYPLSIHSPSELSGLSYLVSAVLHEDTHRVNVPLATKFLGRERRRSGGDRTPCLLRETAFAFLPAPPTLDCKFAPSTRPMCCVSRIPLSACVCLLSNPLPQQSQVTGPSHRGGLGLQG